MDYTHIFPCTVSDIEQAPNLQQLLDEYDAESGYEELGTPAPQFDTYHTLEDNGILHVLGAYRGGELVGFVSIMVSALPHFGKCVATTESFFVAASVRKSGVGLRLLRRAHQFALDVGALGLFVSTPVGGQLEKVMGRMKRTRKTNSIFFMGQ